jgi:uncharacterized protein YegP (UPF0339 family)
VLFFFDKTYTKEAAMKFEIYKGKNGKWFWRLKAKNHETIANGQGYRKKADILHVIRLIKRTIKGKIVDLVEEAKALAREKTIEKLQDVVANPNQ